MNYSGRTAQLLTSKKSASYCNPQKSMYLDRKLGFASSSTSSNRPASMRAQSVLSPKLSLTIRAFRTSSYSAVFGRANRHYISEAQI